MTQQDTAPMTVPRLKGSFKDWVQGSRSKDRVIYHIGEYARGPECRDARDAAEAGQVLLMQRRRSHTSRGPGNSYERGQFEYIAQRT